MSIARAHYQRTLAERQARNADATLGPLGDRMLALLRMHQATLKTIQSRTAKIAAKRDFLPEYGPYVDGVIAADIGVQDEVVVTVMLWRLDVGDWDSALAIGSYAIRHGLSMPDRFVRDLPTTLVEEIAQTALDAPRRDKAMAAPLTAALDLTEGCDMPDEVRAKALKALGQILAETGDAATAVDYLEAALAFDPKCGVKTELTRLKNALPPA